MVFGHVRDKRHPIALAVGLSVLIGVPGCANLPRPPANEHAPDVPQPIQKPSNVIGRDSALDISIGGIPSLNDGDMFVARDAEAEQSEPLPDIHISRFSVSNATIYDILKTVLAGTGVSFSLGEEHAGASIVTRQVSASNISGSLPKIIEMFSQSVGYYYRYTDGVLHITPDRQFIAKIPPVNELFESLPIALKTMGATDVFLDKSARMIVYRATKPVQTKVEGYLSWARENKRLIVYETYIAEVLLNDAQSAGIAWNNLSWSGMVRGTPAEITVSGVPDMIEPGSVGVGAVFTGSRFSMDVLANFLKTQGSVNQLSKIPMMLISGGETVFRNGGTDYYVSSIGAPTYTSTGQAIPGQTELSALNTGVDLRLSGDIYDSTVFTKVRLSMNTLTGFRSFPAGQGQVMQAPITTERAIQTDVRVRPGDTILIAGINYEKHESDVEGLPNALDKATGKGSVLLPTVNNRAAQRSELVVVMKPTVVSFSRAGAAPAARTQRGKTAPTPKSESLSRDDADSLVDRLADLMKSPQKPVADAVEPTQPEERAPSVAPDATAPKTESPTAPAPSPKKPAPVDGKVSKLADGKEVAP